MQLSKRFQQEQQLRLFYYSSLELYQNSSKIPLIRNLETLKLFLKIECAYQQKNKQEVLSAVQQFIENREGKFNQEYGIAKDQLELLLLSNQKKIKITTHEILQHLGFGKKELFNIGVTDTKTQAISKTFEIISLEALKRKYFWIENVIYCGDGKIKISNYYNDTGQKNVDFVLKITDTQNNEHFIAFDHKVKDLQSCIKEISIYGLKYSVFTLGDIEDASFYENPSIKQQLSNFNFEKIELEFKQSISQISYRNPISELTRETLKNITEYEKTGSKEILMKSPLMPVLLINSKDIQKRILELQTRNGIDTMQEE